MRQENCKGENEHITCRGHNDELCKEKVCCRCKGFDWEECREKSSTIQKLYDRIKKEVAREREMDRWKKADEERQEFLDDLPMDTK